MSRWLLAPAALLIASPAAAAVFIGTQIVDTQLRGSIGGMPLEASGSDAGTRAGTITAAAQLVEPAQPADAGGSAVRGVSSVIASLTGTERGRITFRRTLSVAGDGVLTSGSNYVYFFSADAPTAFDFNWGVSAFGVSSGGLAPAQVATLRVRGGGDLLRLDGLGDGASGTTSVLLGAGSYELRVQDAVSPGAAGGVAGGLSSQYSFAMRAVPEPATWAMLMLGFAAVGVAMRRRDRVVRFGRP